MEELKREMGVALAGGEAGCKVFTHPLAFNVIPHIDSFQDNGYTKEEMKVRRGGGAARERVERREREQSAPLRTRSAHAPLVQRTAPY